MTKAPHSLTDIWRGDIQSQITEAQIGKTQYHFEILTWECLPTGGALSSKTQISLRRAPHQNQLPWNAALKLRHKLVPDPQAPLLSGRLKLLPLTRLARVHSPEASPHQNTLHLSSNPGGALACLVLLLLLGGLPHLKGVSP